jgi:SAM-dependent methyltransferase
MSKRPSKSYIFERLAEDLAKIKGGAGVDAASASFKNYPLFKTDRYIGIDISEQALKEGLQRYPGAETILSDLSKPQNFEPIADVCVSTHTFLNIPTPQGRVELLENLVRLLKPEGVLICNMNKDENWLDLRALMRTKFKHVEEVHYRNAFSVWFETCFIDQPKKDREIRLEGVWQRFLQKALFLLEKVTTHVPFLNRCIYFVCRY